MFEQLLHIQANHPRRFRTGLVRGARAFHDWFWHGNDSEGRGLKLLREWLSPQQLAQYDANKYFDVTGCESGRRYRIYHGISMNVHEIDGADRPRTGWCFVPHTNLVAGDVMLAQKIALENDEYGALAVAKEFESKDQLN
jgi:hypothetical protein